MPVMCQMEGQCRGRDIVEAGLNFSDVEAVGPSRLDGCPRTYHGLVMGGVLSLVILPNSGDYEFAPHRSPPAPRHKRRRSLPAFAA